ncbi:hypothetical protein IMZ31_20770 (plasmid) [Pontibacillus sp. ALD_SL1]|uniref:hypothetical protein n=1 Tax=Pontibacillus sp. ALD_SL1 TaxID=2777185 RepID=UPI001A957EFD|nr:hypothetical protein [Pontibacillus sp. ALD_SL1]QST02983.1 hypothetical protein IMZ31_20770 [Pontibacillus sp. ALD_SL1]
MADIFRLITGSSNMERSKKQPDKEAPSSKRLDLDNFIIGEEEKRFQEKTKRTSVEDLFEQEIGVEKETKDYTKDIEKLNFIELDKLNEKKQNRKLKNEYLNLIDKIEEISKEFQSLSQNSSKISISNERLKKENHTLKELVRLVSTLLPSGTDLKRRLDTTSWNVNDISEDLLDHIKKLVDRGQNMDDIIASEVQTIQEENKALKRKLVSMESKTAEQTLSNSPPSETPASEEIPAEETSVSPAPSKEPIIEKNSHKELHEPDEDKEEPVEIETHLLLDMERHIETMPEERQYVIEVIGKTGISRNQELKNYLAEDDKGKQYFQKGNKFSLSDLSAVTKGLKDSGYLFSEKIDLGSKGGFNFQLFELSDTGKAIYSILTKKNPVVPEKKRVKEQHTTYEHGYLIYDSARAFEEMGYKVYTERDDLRFDLPGGRRKDFDLIVEQDGIKQYIEVERGTHTDEGFFEAMDKIYDVMQNLYPGEPATFYFISPNRDLLFTKTKRQFYLWINKRFQKVTNAKGKIIANFSTFANIKDASKSGNNLKKTLWEEQKI